MIRIDITGASNTMRQARQALSPAKVATLTARAINHTIAKGKTAESKALRERYNIRAVSLRKRLSVTRANKSMLSAKVSAPTRPIPLIEIPGWRQTKQGIAITLVKGKRTLIKSAFKTTTRSGRTGIYGRGEYIGKQFKWRKKRIVPTGPDLPIAELHTFSIPSAANTPQVQSPVMRTIVDSYTPRIAHELRHALRPIR